MSYFVYVSLIACHNKPGVCVLFCEGCSITVTMSDKSASNWLVIAAIDFGTTYSGYAFSFRDTPREFHTPQKWYAGTSNLLSQKTPTCILLNPDETFNSFGYEAEDIFTTLASEEKHHEYFYFYHFKMELYFEKVSKSACLSYELMIMKLNNENGNLYLK